MKEEEEIEIWKDIPGYEGYYMASNFGKIKSCNRIVFDINGHVIPIKSNIMSPSITKCGYYQVNLLMNGTKKSFKVHKLIAMTFLNHKPNSMIDTINHINHIKSDNSVKNLEIISHRENTSDSKKQYRKTSIYTGVSWANKNNKNWCAKIKIDGNYINLGYFETEDEACIHYQEALRRINSFNGNSGIFRRDIKYAIKDNGIEYAKNLLKQLII